MDKLKVNSKSKTSLNPLPKIVTSKESEMLDQLQSKKVNTSLGRKRPRNPNEEKVLKRWEKERGGTKIGEI